MLPAIMLGDCPLPPYCTLRASLGSHFDWALQLTLVDLSCTQGISLIWMNPQFTPSVVINGLQPILTITHHMELCSIYRARMMSSLHSKLIKPGPKDKLALNWNANELIGVKSSFQMNKGHIWKRTELNIRCQCLIHHNRMARQKDSNRPSSMEQKPCRSHWTLWWVLDAHCESQGSHIQCHTDYKSWL